MGPTSLSYILGVQNVVKWGRRGAATSRGHLHPDHGGALGVGMLGAALGGELTRRLAATSARIDVAAALRPETHQKLSPEQLRVVQVLMGRSLQVVFLLMLAMGLLAIACSLGLKGGRAEEAGAEVDRSDGAADDLVMPVGIEH